MVAANILIKADILRQTKILEIVEDVMEVNGDETYSLTHTIPESPQANSQPGVILEEVLERKDQMTVNPSCECNLKSLSNLLVEQVGMASVCPAHSSSLCSGSRVDFCGSPLPIVPDLVSDKEVFPI